MRIVSSVGAMQQLARRWRRRGVRVGFVPTMGALHDGHISLVQEARGGVGRRGRVVVSIYVNPTQFGPAEDFAKYPRTLGLDARRCRAAGVDVVFAPSDAEMYPRSETEPFSTFVMEEAVSRGMEGEARPGHFRGVTTIVAKLFHIVQPDLAVFGAKDCQQAAVIRRMVRDLNMPVEIRVAPTLREADGLAMSSRNAYLSTEQRRQATVLSRALRLAARRVRAAKRPVSAGVLRRELERLIGREPEARVDYIAFFEPVGFRAVERVGRGTQMALAVFVGRTRLIDNAIL